MRRARIAIFMIYLVMSIPLMISGAFAQISSVQTSGNLGVEGVRKATDSTKINFTATAGGVPAPENLLRIQNVERVVRCIANDEAGTSQCAIAIPGTLPGGPHAETILMYDTLGGSVVFNAVAEILVDAMPPQHTEFAWKSEEGDVIVERYAATDRLCPPEEGCDAQCGGITKIEFFVNSELTDTLEDDYGCNAQITNKKLSYSGTGSEDVEVCVRAYDAVGQASERNCDEGTVDRNPPEVIDAGLYLGDGRLTYFTGYPQGGLTLQFVISDESDIDVTSITGDLHQLNEQPAMSETLRHMRTPACLPEGNDVRCSWPGIFLLITSSTPTVYFNITDETGNTAEIEYVLSDLVIDDSPAQVTKITTGREAEDGKIWVAAKNNTIYAEIQETGAGLLGNTTITLDTSSMDNAVHFADECVEGWTCYFRSIDVEGDFESGSPMPVFFTNPSVDGAGNEFEGETSTIFYYDNAPPVFVNITDYSVCPVFGENMYEEIIVREPDSGNPSIRVWAEDLSVGFFPVEKECTVYDENEDLYSCPIDFGDLLTEASEGEVYVEIEDFAGNIWNSSEEPIIKSVCESAPGTPPNLIHVEFIRVIPSAGIDKKLAGIEGFDPPLMVELEVRGLNDNVAITRGNVEDCSLEEGDAVAERLYNDREATAYLGLDTQLTNASDLDDALLTCELAYFVRYGNKVFQEPQYINVSIDVPLYGTALGDLNDSVNDKIDGITDQINNVQSGIGRLEKTNEILGTICSLQQFVATTAIILAAISSLLVGLGVVLYGLGAVAVGEALVKAGVWVNMMNTYLVYGVYNPNTAAYFSPGMYLRWVCVLYTCRLSDVDNPIEVIFNTGSANGGHYTLSYDRGGRPHEGQENALALTSAGVTAVAPPVGIVAESLLGYDWDPYQSYYVAQHSLCMPGIIYNLRKKEQILCQYRNCVYDLGKAGYSTAECDQIYKTQECVYFESAGYHMLGGNAAFIAFWQGLAEFLFVYVPTTLIAGAMGSWASTDPVTSCAGYFRNTPTPPDLYGEALEVIPCAAGAAAVLLFDIQDIMTGFDMSSYEADLAGEDFCSGWVDE